MKNILKHFLILGVLLSLVSLVGGCQTTPKSLESSQESSVVLIPQRHYLPSFDSKKSPQPMPQDLNQRAIFDQTSEWIRSGAITQFVIEGCEGELNQESPLEFNGWSLKALSAEKSVEKIQTHVGLKLKAAFKDKVQIVCGDSSQLIKEHQLALSDLRGLAGFKIRLNQKNFSDKDRKKYFAGVRQIFKMEKQKDDKKVLLRLDEEIKKAQARFDDLLSQRNDRFLAKIQSLSGRKAIIIGGLHIQDLKAKLEKQNQTVGVWSPQGLGEDSEDPMSQLNKLLNSGMFNSTEGAH